jgi:hypothetical protein
LLPPISVEEHLVKVRECLDTRFNECLIELARSLEQLETKNIAEVMEIVACRA